MNRIEFYTTSSWTEITKVADDIIDSGNDEIIEGNCYISIDPIGLEIPIDTLEVVVGSEDDLLTALPKGLQLQYLYNDERIGYFVVDNVQRVSHNSYRIYAQSYAVNLDTVVNSSFCYRESNAGNFDTIFSIARSWSSCTLGITASASLAEELFTCNVNTGENLKDILQKLLFAVGGVYLPQRSPGTVSVLGSTGRFAIDDSRIFIGGEVEEAQPVKSIQAGTFTPSYISTADDIKWERVFSRVIKTSETFTYNGTTYTGVRLIYPKSAYSRSVSNATVVAAYNNVLYLQRSGSNEVTVDINPYFNTEETRNLTNNSVSAGQQLTVDSNWFISPDNSAKILTRMFEYYNNRRVITADIVVGPERPGDICELNDPFGNPEVAILTALDINISKTLRATATFVAGYIPEESLYSNYVIVDADTTWTVPAGVTLIRAVLIGGGDGGDGGYPGADGGEAGAYIYGDNNNTPYYFHDVNAGKGGSGGAAGTAGSPGKVYSIELSVTPGDAFVVSIASGGLGGEAGRAGEPGGDTLFGEYSSNLGFRFSAGYSSPFDTNTTYATPGTDGTAGKAGASGTYIRSNVSISGPDNLNPDGAKGGDAGSNAGEIGASGSWSAKILSSGGDGAFPGDWGATTVPGRGGNGGWGGGGGGGAGGLDASTYTSGALTLTYGTPGNGGNGGRGQDGGPGCVIIYY